MPLCHISSRTVTLPSCSWHFTNPVVRVSWDSSPVFSVGLWKISSLSLLPLDQRRACPSPLHVGLGNSCRAGLPQPSSLGQKAISRPPPTQHSPPLLQMKGQGLSLQPGARWLQQKGISIVLYMPDQFVFWLQFYHM